MLRPQGNTAPPLREEWRDTTYPSATFSDAALPAVGERLVTIVSKMAAPGLDDGRLDTDLPYSTANQHSAQRDWTSAGMWQ